MSKNSIAELIQKVDPAKVQRMYPTKQQFQRYLKYKQDAGELLEKVGIGGLPEDCVSKVGPLTAAIRQLANEVSSTTELGGKLLVNEMVIWADTHHLEKAIYLAGRCHERNIKEPYRTQIMLQPANACMARYRQVYKVYEWIRDNIQADLSGDVGAIVTGMLKALLDQFESFAISAYDGNPNHAHAVYFLALSYLFRAHEFHAAGRMEEASEYCRKAFELVNGLNEPTTDSLKVELQYHVRNYQEFVGFERMHKQHENISKRLGYLGKRANQILDAGGGQERPCYFWINSYVGGTSRASIAGLICVSAGAFGIDMDVAKAAVDQLWHIVASSIPGVDPNVMQQFDRQVALHTGGLVISNVKEMSSMIHTGGLV